MGEERKKIEGKKKGQKKEGRKEKRKRKNEKEGRKEIERGKAAEQKVPQSLFFGRNCV